MTARDPLKTRMGSDPDGVFDAELDCLIRWPEGTNGWYQEQEVLRTLNNLCKRYGYGRIPQLAAGIAAVWRDPAEIEKQKKEQKHHNECIASCRAAVEKSSETKT